MALAVALMLVLVLIAALPGSAHAFDVADGSRQWGIWSGNEKVGRYVATFRHSGKDLMVESHLSIVPRVLEIAVARFKQTELETWRDGRLVALEASTNRDGKKVNLTVRATASGLAVNGPAGDYVVLSALYPSSLWDVAMTKTDRLLDIDTGRTLAVQFIDGPEVPIQVKEVDVRARQISVAGDLKRDLWYGPDGILVRMQFRAPSGELLDFRAE